jgi:hypothetical protein
MDLGEMMAQVTDLEEVPRALEGDATTARTCQ